MIRFVVQFIRMKKAESLKLSNQICFPIYALSKEVINLYRPFLNEIDLTYPQYLVMLVLWENDGLTVGTIGEKLALDTGTLTPLLKRLEAKDIIQRKRSESDERIVLISLSEKGKSMQELACNIPIQMKQNFDLTDEEIESFKNIINKILNSKTSK